jgi:hypothetical protein
MTDEQDAAGALLPAHFDLGTSSAQARAWGAVKTEKPGELRDAIHLAFKAEDPTRRSSGQFYCGAQNSEAM